MNNRKSFYKGLLSGILVTSIICIIVGNLGIFFRGQGPDMGKVNRKVSEIQKLIDQNFYFEEDANKMEEGIYKGMVYGLGDDYSVYMSPEEAQSLHRSTAGKYCGIGAQVGQNRETLASEITKVFKKSPAEEAGLRVGDVIIKVDGTDVTEMELSTIIADCILGEEGSNVMITVHRPEEEKQIELTVTRREIIVETVLSEMLDQKTGYIHIKQFEMVTPEQFQKAIESLKEQGMESVIYDVRGNPGGSLTAVVSMLDYILPDGLLVYTADKNGNKLESYEGQDGHEVNLPTVVLTDTDSASASELFASAIRDYERGKLVGENTFGKGIVQNAYNLKDGSLLKITVSAYFTKSGYAIQGNGIKPDLQVEVLEPFDVEAETALPKEDIQLQAAMELLDK